MRAFMDTYKYILEKVIYKEKERISLIRIRMDEGTGVEGEEYFDGDWHRYDGALSYLPDPSPGDFIDEEEAMEVMKLIDQSN
jgi:hypothetical protein